MHRGTDAEPDLRRNDKSQVSTLYSLCAEERPDKPSDCLLMKGKGKGRKPAIGEAIKMPAKKEVLYAII